MKNLRSQLHLSQDYVAKYLRVDRSTVNQMESGDRKILPDEASKLCALFGVSADALINEVCTDDQAEIMNMVRFKEQIKAQHAH